MIGMTGIEVMDRVVEECKKNDILVIQNIHVNDVGWCCDITDEDGLWNTRKHPTDQWLESIQGITRRYANQS